MLRQVLAERDLMLPLPLGYLETGLDAAAATSDDPRLDHEPELARTMGASVTQRIPFGERAGQKVRRLGSGCGSQGTTPYRSSQRQAG